MKKYFYSIFALIGALLVACTPKTSTAVQETADKMEKVEEVVSNDFRASAPDPGPARSIKIGKAEQFNLTNGLTVIVVENHKIPRVSYSIFVNRNPILEGDKAGYVSMAGQLMSTGTKTKSKSEIDEAVDFVGGRLSTHSRGGFASSLKKHSEYILGLLSEVLLTPTFPAEEFDKIKKQTLTGIVAQKEDPNAISANISSVANYGKDHVYGEIETEETVSNIKVEDCRNYYNTYIKPNEAYLVIVGDITAQEAEFQANKYFASWKSGKINSQPFENVSYPEGTRIKFVDKTAAVQSVINVTYPVDLKPGSNDYIAAELMNNILGYGGFSGRLFQNLREDKAYTYGAYSNLDSDEFSGSFSAQTSVRNEVTDSAIVELLAEMNRIANDRVSPEELQLTKNLVFGEFARSMENPQTIARFALNTARYGLSEDYYENYLATVEKVTIEDIKRVAQKYIKPDNANIVVVGNSDEVIDKLKAKWPIDYYDNLGNNIELKPSAPINIDGKTLVENYIKAIGGRAKLEGVKDTYLKMEANVPQMGGAMIMEQYSKDNSKFKMSISMQGMTVQEQIYDGEKMKVSQMGQGEVVTDENALKQARDQAIAFKDLMYFDEGYSIKVSGSEKMGDEDIVKIIITDPEGAKTTEYYNMNTFLKVKQISTQEVQGKSVSSTTEFKDYKEIDGIKVPHLITISGAMPMPLTFELKEGSFNKGVSDDLFIIE